MNYTPPLTTFLDREERPWPDDLEVTAKNLRRFDHVEDSEGRVLRAERGFSYE